MKKWMFLSIMLCASALNGMAQDDDMYFVPTKANVAKQKSSYGIPATTYYSGSSRSVDDYNRRGSSYEVLPADTGDVISFAPIEGVYPDSVSDFRLTREMQRWDGYEPALADSYKAGYAQGRRDTWMGWGWHSPWYYSYYPWYDGWGGWYGWYDPWYYGSWYYDPWYYGYGWHGYYSSWYRPSWYYGWYGGGVGHAGGHYDGSRYHNTGHMSPNLRYYDRSNYRAGTGGRGTSGVRSGVRSGNVGSGVRPSAGSGTRSSGTRSSGTRSFVGGNGTSSSTYSGGGSRSSGSSYSGSSYSGSSSGGGSYSSGSSGGGMRSGGGSSGGGARSSGSGHAGGGRR